MLDLPLRVQGRGDAAHDARVQAQVPPHVPGRVAAAERVMPGLPVLAHPHSSLHSARHPAVGARPAITVRRRPPAPQVTELGASCLLFYIRFWHHFLLVINDGMVYPLFHCSDEVRLIHGNISIFSHLGEIVD